MIEVKLFSPEQWKEYSENAHQAVFKESWCKTLEKIDFAMLMVKKETDEVVSYATVQVKDEISAYLQYGGAFPNFQGTPTSYQSFVEMLRVLRGKFSRISTLVENNNFPMLKFYVKEKFKITGMRFFKTSTLLMHTYESES